MGPGVAPSVQAGSVQPSGHGTRRHHCPAHSQLVADAAGGPLVGAAPVLDEVHRLGTGLGGTVGWGAGAALKLRDSSLAVTSDPLRQRGTSDTGFSRYMSDGATSLDTHHEPVAAPRRQHSVTVGHDSGDFYCQNDDSAPLILTAKSRCPHPRLRPHDSQQLGMPGRDTRRGRTPVGGVGPASDAPSVSELSGRCSAQALAERSTCSSHARRAVSAASASAIFLASPAAWAAARSFSKPAIASWS